MIERTTALAYLARRAVEATFDDDGDASQHVRVNCLERPEISSLVHALREWQPPNRRVLRVAVTAREPWAGLTVDDIVPNGAESPTTLRNAEATWVVLIEGDDYSDKQGWANVLPISDRDLLDSPEARCFLTSLYFGATPSGVLVDVLEATYDALGSVDGRHVPIRDWIEFVRALAGLLAPREVLDADAAWAAVGEVLPACGLFADDRLGEVHTTDRRRMLNRNARESARIVADSDDGWRDRLRELVDDFEFLERNGEPAADQSAIRAAAAKVLGAFGKHATRGLLFRYWEQLLDGGKTRKGLGTRIREWLQREYPARVAEYDLLGVTEGIDASRPEEAIRLLNQDPDDESTLPIPALLDRRLRSALERLAKPRAPRSTRPLSDLVRVVADMVAERETLISSAERSMKAKLEIVPRTVTKDAERSRALFGWLFGATLSEVAECTADDDLALELSAELTTKLDHSSFEKDSDADDQDDSDPFAVLELRVAWSDRVGSERRIEWDPAETPGLVALWRYSTRSDTAYWRPSADVSFDTWLDSSLQRAPMLGAVRNAERDDAPDPVRTWDGKRAMHLDRLRDEGLSCEAIRKYRDDYLDVLQVVRTEYVPAGVGRPEVEDLLRRDFFLGNGSTACLASHPLRMRWVAAYFELMADLLQRALHRKLATNPVSPELYFEQILDTSPQAQPPIVVFDEQLSLAVREKDWHEVFAPLKDSRSEKRDWLADLDDGAIDDVGETVGRYLDAYPYKSDGLHLLYVVRRSGARGLHRLVKKVLERTGTNGASLKLTLFVDTAEIRSVEECLQDFDDPDHRALSDRPPLLVDLHTWPDPEAELPDVSKVGPYVDLAVVPNLFGASTRTQETTAGGLHHAATFNPLLDEPTRLEAVRTSDGLSTTVSRVLLPEGRDAWLESWSTIVTRQFRGAPVSESPSGGDIDHAMIRVSLDRNRSFFDALHACAHWVVTVDAFVGREQIEALDGGPDVIQVKTGVGANGGYRMVVSSKVGREFVTERLTRRLREQLPQSLLPDPARAAEEIYRRARLLVPGIVLRSLGLGRTTAELVGLVLARTRVEQVDPARVAPHGFQSWISLDEHTDWSGGHTKVRADLVRFRGRVVDGRLKLRIDVVEAKLRPQPAVGRADAQLARSIELLSAAFGIDSSGGEAVDYADKDVWSRLISRAIEQSSSAADETPAATHGQSPNGRTAGLDAVMQAMLRQGACEIEAIEGVLVSLTNDRHGRDGTTPQGHRWLRMTMDEVAETLSGLGASQRFPLLDAVAEESTTEQSELTPSGDVVEPQGSPMSVPEVPGVSAEVIGSPDDSILPTQDQRQDESRGGATRAARQRLQQLIDALHVRGIEVRPADVDAALEGPGFYLFRVELGRDVRPESVFALDTHLQYQLGLEAGQVPRMYVDRGAMVFEIPKREEERYYVAARDLWRRFEWRMDRLAAPIGSDVRDRAVAIDFSSSRSPHLLVGGMTGGGKSVALEALLLGLVRHYSADQLELRIVDPKGNEFTQFEELPHVPEPPGMDATDAIEMLERTCVQMDDRYDAMKRLSRERKERVRDIAAYNALVGPEHAFKWIVVVLDEFADLTADKDDKKRIEALLQRIAQKARACGIHAIVATQKPSAEVISTTTRSNLGAQLALRVRSATDSRVIMEATGAESLAGNGDGYLRLSGAEPIRIQCARAD